MASSSSSSIHSHHIRSISLPSRSHPSTLCIEEELAHLRKLEASTSSLPAADTIHSSLTGFERVYVCLENFLSLLMTQQSLSHCQHEKLVDELLDQSMSLLDVCGSTRDILLQVKEHVQEVQSAQRRKRGDFSFDTSLISNLKKDEKRALAVLKQINNKAGCTLFLDLDYHLSSVIRSSRDVNAVSISVFRSLLLFLSESISKPKLGRRSTVSKLIHKGTIKAKDQLQSSSETIECYLDDFENGLECVFRSLIKARATLLNFLSH